TRTCRTGRRTDNAASAGSIPEPSATRYTKAGSSCKTTFAAWPPLSRRRRGGGGGAPSPPRGGANRGAAPCPRSGDGRGRGREGKLNLALRAEKLVIGNKYDCRHVIETLGACSVLETAEYPGFTTKWTSFAARQARPSVRVECDPPIAFWSAGHGVGRGGV